MFGTERLVLKFAQLWKSLQIYLIRLNVDSKDSSGDIHFPGYFSFSWAGKFPINTRSSSRSSRDNNLPLNFSRSKILVYAFHLL